MLLETEMVVPNTFEESEIRNRSSKGEVGSVRMVDALGLTIVEASDIVEAEHSFHPDQDEQTESTQPKKSFKLFFKR